MVVGAAILAGILYGVLSEQIGGSVAAIGVFYGIEDPIVGWLTHEFHSVVFAFVFAGLVPYAPGRYQDDVLAYAAIGAGWGIAVWAVAASVVAPLWLTLVGIPAPIPNFSPVLLATHLVWGSSLGVLTWLGYRYVVPWMSRVAARLDATVGSRQLGGS